MPKSHSTLAAPVQSVMPNPVLNIANMDIDKIVVQHCEPLFLTDPFLVGGFSAERANGTITYIQYGGQLYGITCAHVYLQQYETEKWLTIHGEGPYVYQLGRFTAEGYKSNFRSLRNKPDSDEPDIAIIYLGDTIKEVHFPKKGKSAINLDAWSDPCWEEIEFPSAFGYPTEHKTQSTKFVESPLIHVTAEVTRTLSPHDSSFLLASTLDNEHGYFFSGMSGGPVFYANEDGEITLIGIVYEGAPGSSKEWQARDEQAFLTNNDIQIRAHIITPDIFQSWLKQVGLVK